MLLIVNSYEGEWLKRLGLFVYLGRALPSRHSSNRVQMRCPELKTHRKNRISWVMGKQPKLGLFCFFFFSLSFSAIPMDQE